MSEVPRSDAQHFLLFELADACQRAREFLSGQERFQPDIDLITQTLLATRKPDAVSFEEGDLFRVGDKPVA